MLLSAKLLIWLADPIAVDKAQQNTSGYGLIKVAPGVLTRRMCHCSSPECVGDDMDALWPN